MSSLVIHRFFYISSGQFAEKLELRHLEFSDWVSVLANQELA